MAYTEITNAQIDADSPITASLMAQLRDNPLSIPNQQTFTTSGTWTKPTETDRGTYALIQVWGAGGAGNSYGGAGSAAGGGGGSYKSRIVLLSALGATETITVGVGGVGGSINNHAPAGGSSSFGSHVEAFGGGGAYSTQAGGAGGGVNSAGSSPGNDLCPQAVNVTENTAQFSGPGTGAKVYTLGTTIWIAANGGYHTGGGGSVSNTNAGNGGPSVYGGGGGSSVNGTTGGISSFAGNGGDYGLDGGTPAGGGGKGADGGDGQVIVYTF